jgi:hypothetical protein
MRPHLACRWADIALLGVAINLVAIVVAPLLRPDLDPLRDSLSYYAVGPWAGMQTAAFAALGIASAMLALALPQSRVASPWMVATIPLLVVAGMFSLGLVLYPMGSPGPVTFLGDAHQTAGTVAGVAQLAATLAFAFAVRDHPTWRGVFRVALVASAAAVAGALLSQAAIWWPQLGIPMGATMRLLVVPLVLFWGFVAVRLRRSCGRVPTRSGGAR